MRYLNIVGAGEWTLPGGFVHTDTDEDAVGAASRVLKTKAGIESPYLEPSRTKGLVEAIRARTEPFGGVELEIAPREAMREPIDFDK